MTTIKTDILKPDMVFSADVFLDATTLFVAKGVPIAEKDIANLKKWKVKELFTEGHALRSSGARKEMPFSTGPIPSAVTVNSTLAGIYNGLALDLGTVFHKLKTSEDIIPVVIDRAVDSLFTLAQTASEEIVLLVLTIEKPESGHACNALNTALISLLIGMNLKLPNHRLVQLTTGALLHDIGMVLLPDSILKKKSNLGDDEFKRIKEHPVQSGRIITKILKYPEDIGRIALHHHERWDGEGYPAGLKGEDIDLHARIVSVADSFDAMVSSRPYRDPMIGYMAMKSLLSDNSRRFDPSVLKIFIKTFGIYPIGSIVLLSDSRVGQVVKVCPESPIRPRIRILAGAANPDEPGQTVDLQTEKQLFIVRAVNPLELRRERMDK